MDRTKFSVGMRNKLAELAMECDSASAIREARMTNAERTELQNLIAKAVEYIDNKIR